MSSKSDNQPEDSAASEQGFISHLFELRDRLIRVVLLVLILFGVVFSYWTDVYAFLSGMIETIKTTGEGGEKIVWQNLRPAGGFFTAIRLSTSAALFLAMPYIFFQLWRFVAPGLYEHERKLVVPIIIGGTILFYLGILFARYVVLPIFFGFADDWIPANTENKYDIMYFLDFTIKMFFAFGLAFQVPIVTIVLVWGGISTPDSLAEKRPYVIVGAFVIGMLLTPPDVVSQVLLAVPMWVLFEAGIVVSRVYKPNGPSADDDDDDPDSDGGPGAGKGKKGPDGPKSGGSDHAVSSVIPGSAAAANAAADDLAEENSGNKTESDEVEEESLVISSEGGTGVDEYDSDYVPLDEDEMDAELDRFDEEMNALEASQDAEREKEEQEKEEQEKAEKEKQEENQSESNETSDTAETPSTSDKNKSPESDSTPDKNGDKNN